MHSTFCVNYLLDACVRACVKKSYFWISFYEDS